MSEKLLKNKLPPSETQSYKPNTLYLENFNHDYATAKNLHTNNNNNTKSCHKHQKHRSSPPQSRHRKVNIRSSSLYPLTPSPPHSQHIDDGYNLNQYSISSNYVYTRNICSDDTYSSNLSSNLNFNYEYKSSGGETPSATITSATTNSPSFSIANDDIEVFNRLNREDLMIDHFRWLSEKPLSVLQLDPADRAVLKIAGNANFNPKYKWLRGTPAK